MSRLTKLYGLALLLSLSACGGGKHFTTIRLALIKTYGMYGDGNGNANPRNGFFEPINTRLNWLLECTKGCASPPLIMPRC